VSTTRFRVVVVGRGRSSWADEAVADYTGRVRRFGGVGEEDVKSEPFRGDVDRVRATEGERVLARVGPRDKLVVLDERGERLDSEAFSLLVDQGRQLGSVVFAIGGPYGHAEAVRRAAWRVIRLSDLVLNHHLARVVLYEQLYRALTLIEGVPYHH
jgi:23S rRNA (pseudouridine1915-N3)-methyltransferase